VVTPKNNSGEALKFFYPCCCAHMRFRDFVFFVVTTLRDDGWSPPTPQRIASRCSGDFVSPTVQVQDLYIASRNSAAHELFPLQNARKRDKKFRVPQLFASGSKSFFFTAPPTSIYVLRSDQSSHCMWEPTSLIYRPCLRRTLGRVLCVVLFCKCLGEERIAGGEDRRRRSE